MWSTSTNRPAVTGSGPRRSLSTSKKPRRLQGCTRLFVLWQRVPLRLGIVLCGGILVLIPFLLSTTVSNKRGVVPTIKATSLPVQVDDPFQCQAIQATTKKEKPPVFQPKNPYLVEGFPATPTIGTGFLREHPESDAMLFKAHSSKLPNGPILSTGSDMFFTPDNEDEYRLLWVKASLNYTAILREEGVESDICLDIGPADRMKSCSSGEEVLCVHESYFGGDSASIKPLLFNFAPGGFPLRKNTRISIASVSKIFTSTPFVPLDEESVKKRDAPDKPTKVGNLGDVATSLNLLALDFEALLVPSDSQGLHQHSAIRSVRSPLRDRSILTTGKLEALPLTAFQNTKSTPLQIVGLGIFRSMLNHYISGDTLIRIVVDGKEVHRLCPVPHRPGVRSAPFEEVVPFTFELPPQSTIRIEHNVSAFLTGTNFYIDAPYDLAVYILYEHPDHSSDALVPTDEIHLGDGTLDLNGDGFPDFVDYDAYGHIWSELTLADGTHDTQHLGFPTLITNKGRFNKPTTVWKWTRDKETNMMEALVTDETSSYGNPLCFKIRSQTLRAFLFEYCDESRVPFKTFIGNEHRTDNFCVGDFDGDGYMDRIRLEPKEPTVLHPLSMSLYFAEGDGSKFVSERLVATVDKGCLNDDHPRLECLYNPSLQRHVAGYPGQCGKGYQMIDTASLKLK